MSASIIIDSTLKLSDSIKQLSEKDFVHKSFNIDCEYLPIPKQEGNIYEYHLYANLFNELHIDKNSPYVYWFQIKNDIDCFTVRKLIGEYTNNLKKELELKLVHDDRTYFSVPAMTKTIKSTESKVLYVGKVKSDLKGRLVPHLGYYHRSPNTQGLQLARWTRDLNLQLEFHYVKLPQNLKELTSYFEFALARELKPILGKHR